MGVLVIAEPGMTWDRNLDDAYRLIDAAKECGADVCKFQWTSSGKKLQERRQVDPKYIAIYERGVQYPREWLEQLKAHCDSVGIEFACTTYLIEDIAVVAPLVKRFKVSAYESRWEEFVEAHYYKGKEIVVSSNNAVEYNPPNIKLIGGCGEVKVLHCISKYPTPIDDLNLDVCSYEQVDGLSDHSANVLTGAAAVAAGGKLIEAHIRLEDTSPDNPDYGHSLVADSSQGIEHSYLKYVRNIRTVERML